MLLLSEGQMSDHKGAAILLPALPPAPVLIADRGYDSNRFRAALGSRLVHVHHVIAAASATAEAKLVASLS